MPETTELQDVRVAAANATQARDELVEAIKRATKVCSLREVARAAGVSHEKIRRLAG